MPDNIRERRFAMTDMTDVAEHTYDVTVVGGGVAGICAAIAAVRRGARTAVVHDRPLLGGNASGELRVHIAGTDCSGASIARYLRETGIVDEIRLEETLVEEGENYQQRRVRFFAPVTTDVLRVNIYETNGVPEARVFEVRVY